MYQQVLEASRWGAMLSSVPHAWPNSHPSNCDRFSKHVHAIHQNII